MMDISNTYKSRTRAIPEELSRDVFDIDASLEGKLIEKYDLGFRNRLNNVMQDGQIPFEGTYFIVDIGHAHLVGVGEELTRQGIESYFMIPGKANARMQETLKYWKQDYEVAKDNLENPKGYATLIDCHRDGNPIKPDGGYSLLPSAFPTAEKLKELEVKRVVFMNEGRSKLEKPYGAYASRELRQVIEKYEAEGIEFVQHGIWPFPNEQTERLNFDIEFSPMMFRIDKH